MKASMTFDGSSSSSLAASGSYNVLGGEAARVTDHGSGEWEIDDKASGSIQRKPDRRLFGLLGGGGAPGVLGAVDCTELNRDAKVLAAQAAIGTDG